MNKRIAAILAVVVVAIVVVGYVYYAYLLREQRPQVRLVVVTRLSADEAEDLKKAFLASSIAKEFGIIDVEFKKVDYVYWGDLGRSGEVDLFFVGEAEVYNRLCSEGALRAVDDEYVLKLVAEMDRGFVGSTSNGSVCWIAVGVGAYGFIANSDYFESRGLQIPRSWRDLLSVDYAKVALEGVSLVSYPFPSKSGTARTIIAALLQKYGWEDGWRMLTILGAISSFVGSSEKARDDAISGVVGVAPAYLGYGVYAENVSRGRAVFIFPVGETVLYVSPVALAAGTKHPREAQAFIRWLLSDEGQRFVVQRFYYMPVRDVSGVEAFVQRSKQALQYMFDYNSSEAGLYMAAVTLYFESAIADPDAQRLLQEVYRRALQLYLGGAITEEQLESVLKELGAPLAFQDPTTGGLTEFTKDEVVRLSRALSSDSGLQAALSSSIKQAALTRYQSLLEKLKTYG